MEQARSAGHLDISPNHIIIVSEPTSSLRAALACLSWVELIYYVASMMFVQMRRHFPETGKNTVI
ncbi:MAG: hypothetical protein ACTSPB_26045 [Candidatus Thorarchaeota archaeon]